MIEYLEEILALAFIAAMFIIAKMWKQFKCLSTDRWIEKCGTYIQRNTILLKREGNLTYGAKWMNLECIVLSEKKKSKEDKYCMIPHIRDTWNCQIHKIKEWNSGFQCLEGGENGKLLVNRYKVSVK